MNDVPVGEDEDEGMVKFLKVKLKFLEVKSLFLEVMTHSQMLGKVESGEGPFFKVVLEC